MLKTLTVVVSITVLMSGCAGPGGSDAVSQDELLDQVETAYEQGKETGYDMARAEFARQEVVVDERDNHNTVDVVSGKYESFAMNVSDEATLTYLVLQYAGPRFDILFLDAANLERLEDGKEFNQLDRCSDWYTSTIKRTCSPPQGRWYLVIENGEWGGVEPYADEYGEETLRLRLTFQVTEMKRLGEA